MVKWRGRLWRGRVEDRKLYSHLEWPNRVLIIDKTPTLYMWLSGSCDFTEMLLCLKLIHVK